MDDWHVCPDGRRQNQGYLALLAGKNLQSKKENEHDFCNISIPKTATASPRPRNGVRGGGKGRPHCAAAWQSHFILPLAQCVATPAATRSLHRPRSARH